MEATIRIALAAVLAFTGGAATAREPAAPPDWLREEAARVKGTVSALKARCGTGEDPGGAEACAQLGLLLLTGRNTAADPSGAAAAAQASCEGGSVPGCALLGWILHEGIGRDDDPASSALVFEQACDGGHAPACFHRALAWERGEGVAREEPLKARELFRKACEAGYTPACEERPALGGSSPPEIVSRRVPERTLAEPRDAIEERFAKGCKAADPEACADLGVRLAFGPNPVPSSAVEPALRGCRGGVARGCFVGGWLLFRGEGFRKDAFQAVSLLAKGCDLADALACGELAWAYVSGDGTPRDPDRALALAQRACELDAKTGCNTLGAIASTNRRSSLGREAFEKACAAGNCDACQRYYEGSSLGPQRPCNKPEAPAGGRRPPAAVGPQELARSCERGDARACFSLGLMLARPGELHDGPAAARALGRSCAGGFTPGCTLQGLQLCFEPGTRPEEKREGLRLLERSCSLGTRYACTALGAAYWEGLCGGRDRKRAVRLWEDACKAGEAEACRAVRSGAVSDENAL